MTTTAELRPLVLAALLAGCTHERGPVVDHRAWTEVAPEDDPWTDAPDPVDCAPGSFGYEFEGGVDTFEVDTQDCNYVTVRTETTGALFASDTVVVRLWHFALSSAEVAEAHAELRIGGRTYFDRRVPIPADSEMLTEETASGVLHPAGTEVLFHLHNHGANSWALVSVDADF